MGKKQLKRGEPVVMVGVDGKKLIRLKEMLGELDDERAVAKAIDEFIEPEKVDCLPPGFHLPPPNFDPSPQR